MKIGVFDSGLGGLSILKGIIGKLPEYDYVYLGDNARVPYGGRSPETIYEFTKQAIDFLLKKNCKLIIIACNSATATSLKKIQQEYLPKKWPDRKVLGVIKPTIEKVEEIKSKRVGVIGTRVTINSISFIKEIKKISPRTKVFQNSTPLLVPIIEEGEADWDGTNLILEKYLSPLLNKKIDSLILGCTHYGLIAKKIKKIVGNKIRIITEAEEVAEKLGDYLKRHSEIDKSLNKNKQREFYVTDFSERYENIAKMFMGGAIELKSVK